MYLTAMKNWTSVMWMSGPDPSEGLDANQIDAYLGMFGLLVQRLSRHAQKASLPLDDAAVVVLDLIGLDADSRAAMLRACRQHHSVAVLALLPPATPAERAVALEHGADDCLSWPIERRELVARVQSLIRRQRRRANVRQEAEPAQWVRFGPWLLDTQRRALTDIQGQEIALSQSEYRLLLTFLQMPHQVFSRDRLMDEARGRGMDAFERSIDLLVSRLRAKLGDDPRQPRLIQTVRGQGYVFNAAPALNQGMVLPH